MKLWHAFVGLGMAGSVIAVLALNAKRDCTRAAHEPADAVVSPATSEPTKPQIIFIRQEVAQAVAPPSAELALAKPDADHAPATAAVSEEERAVVLEQAFRAEIRGNAGREMEGTLSSEFNAPGIRGAHINSIECRTRRCRVDVTFDDLQADQSTIRRVFMSAESKLNVGMSVVRQELPDGRLRAILYTR